MGLRVFQRYYINFLWLLLLFTQPALSVAAVFELELESGVSFTIERFGSGDDRLLWLPSEYGLQGENEHQLAKALAGDGLEVWLVDLHGSYFLPAGRDSLRAIPREDIRGLIARAQPASGQLSLLSYGRGAALLLEAARLWQLSAAEGQRPLGGALLLHPNLMAGAARAGEVAEMVPIASATNLPLFVFQPMNSAKRWYLADLVEQLRQGGSDVFLRTLPGVSDGYQVRDDATDYEREARKKLPSMLRSAMRMLEHYNKEPRSAVDRFSSMAMPGVKASAGLQPVAAMPEAPPLELSDLNGEEWDLSSLTGEVVLLNFWATWCPPCVEEIPSLGRLNQRLAQRPFRVVSIDVGESKEAVEAFLKQVPAKFPVLLDPEGVTTGPWKIRAFPTSFLIDRQGRVRYGYFGALEWDAPEVVALIEKLLQEGQ